MPILYRLYSTEQPRVHYFGICREINAAAEDEQLTAPATTKAALHAEFGRLWQAYTLYARGIPRMVGGEPLREPWEASFDVLKKHGREMVLIEAVAEFPDMSDDFVEAVLKSTVQGEVDIEWQKKASDMSQCVNVIYRKWPHSQGFNSDLRVPGKGAYVF